MMRKIYICGVHCSGKTTLIDCLKSQLSLKNGTMHYSDEVARRILMENEISAKDQRNPEIFKNLNLKILEEQCKKEHEVEWLEDPNSSLCMFDRGILDPIVYLQKRVGKQYAKTVLQKKEIWNIVERYQNVDNCIVFVTKPYLEYFHYDDVRVDTFDFDDCVDYDVTMRKLMTDLKIPFVYIEAQNLQNRADAVLNAMATRWPDLKFAKNGFSLSALAATS